MAVSRRLPVYATAALLVRMAGSSARVATLALGGAAVIGGIIVATLPATGSPSEAAKIGARDLLAGSAY